MTPAPWIGGSGSDGTESSFQPTRPISGQPFSATLNLQCCEATPLRLLSLIAVLALARPAAAADPAAQFITKLFIDVCVPNLGRPAAVREWAQAHRLPQIESQAALGLFVGSGTNGAAWAVPAPQGTFALSIRGTTQACAVWARTADPSEVLTNFQKVIEGVRRPGITVSVQKDETSPSPSGDARALIYNVGAPNAPSGFLFTLLTAERPGGAFQASMRAAQATTR
jgi:hypothetical protein